MDIITHAAIGVTLAGTVAEQPALAAGLLIGSVLPDLDVLARLFGRRAMMIHHQTYSHSLPLLLLVSCVCGLIPELGWMFASGLFAGAGLHVLMDYSNTLGVTLLWPVVRRRLQVGWVFFIDAFVMTVTLVAAAMVLIQLFDHGSASPRILITEAIVLAGYWCVKGWLKHRALICAGEHVISITPSAVVPWHFFVCKRCGAEVTVERLSLVGKQRELLASHQVCDAEVIDIVRDMPEWRLMRDLSPAYHAIADDRSAKGRTIVCRDLRIRNFNTRFGDLEVHVAPDGSIAHSTFHV